MVINDTVYGAVATFDRKEIAEQFREFLNDAGYEAVIDDDKEADKNALIKPKVESSRVMVAEENLQKARGLLLESKDAEHLKKLAILCPECSSADVEYPTLQRNSFFFNLIGMISYFGEKKHNAYCYNCHHQWPVSETRGAPKPKAARS